MKLTYISAFRSATRDAGLFSHKNLRTFYRIELGPLATLTIASASSQPVRFVLSGAHQQVEFAEVLGTGLLVFLHSGLLVACRSNTLPYYKISSEVYVLL